MSPHDWHRQGQIIRARGHDIFVVDTGPPSPRAPTVFLLHGFPTSSWDWRALIPLLSGSVRCVALDFLGFGYSAKPRPHRYRIEEQADLVEAVADALGIQAFHLLAHDYGDTVAQELLARDFDRIDARRVRSACFLNGVLFPETRPRLVQRLQRSFGPTLAWAGARSAFQWSFPRQFGAPSRPAPAAVDDVWHQVQYNDGATVLPSVAHYLDQRQEHRDRWMLALIQSYSPLMVINGSLDAVTGAPMVDRFRERVHHGEVVELAEVGHFPQIEAPRLVARAYRSWMEALLGHTPPHRWDLLVRGAMVFDGHGSPPAVQDVAIRAGRVVERRPGLDRRRADEVVEASGRWLMPGMVDVGSQLGEPPSRAALREALRCGCTSVAATARAWEGPRTSQQRLERISTPAQRVPLVLLSALCDAVGHGAHARAARQDEIVRALRRGYAGVFADVSLPWADRRQLARTVRRFGRVLLRREELGPTAPTALLHKLRGAALAPNREHEVAQVVHALTGMRARRFGLDRGTLDLDSPADLVVVDPQALLRSVTAQPIREVWCGGARVVRSGELTGCSTTVVPISARRTARER